MWALPSWSSGVCPCSHASLSRLGLQGVGRCTVSGVGAGLEGLKRPPADLFSTTGGHHSSVGKGLWGVGLLSIG